jgi:transcriptional regulator of arginine metabolism
MNKRMRQGQILKLLQRKKIRTQEELAKELAAVGIAATQVTLSRDVRELGLVKTPEGYAPVGASPAASGPRLAALAGEFLRDARVAQNQLVLKTSPGNANTLAVAIDQEDWPEVVGTIAGDDTILVVAPDSRTAEQLRDKLLAMTK